MMIITIAGVTVYSLSVAVWTVKSFRYSIWECLKVPVRSCSADPYKAWRTAHGMPGGTVPHCNASSSRRWAVLSSFLFFFPPPLPQVTNRTCFFCSSLYFDLPCALTLHISASNLLLICCTCIKHMQKLVERLKWNCQPITILIKISQYGLFNSHLSLSALYVWAISGTSGSSGLGSHRSEQIDNNTVEEFISKYFD